MSDEQAGSGPGPESDSDSGSDSGRDLGPNADPEPGEDPDTAPDSDAGTGAPPGSGRDAERDGFWKTGQAPVGREPAAGDGTEKDRDVDEAAEEESDEEHEPSVAGVFGARPDDAPPRQEIVPERIDPENALFLLLGALFGLFVVYQMVAVFSA